MFHHIMILIYPIVYYKLQNNFKLQRVSIILLDVTMKAVAFELPN